MKQVGHVNTVSTGENFHLSSGHSLLANIMSSTHPRQLPQRTVHSKIFVYLKLKGGEIKLFTLKNDEPNKFTPMDLDLYLLKLEAADILVHGCVVHLSPRLSYYCYVEESL